MRLEVGILLVDACGTNYLPEDPVPALVLLPRFMAVCVSDDTAVPLVRVSDPCPEHPAATEVYVEVIPVSATPQFGLTLCRECMDEINWVLSEITYSPVA
jgi:hypothetical protein